MCAYLFFGHVFLWIASELALTSRPADADEISDAESGTEDEDDEEEEPEEE